MQVLTSHFKTRDAELHEQAQAHSRFFPSHDDATSCARFFCFETAGTFNENAGRFENAARFVPPTTRYFP